MSISKTTHQEPWMIHPDVRSCKRKTRNWDLRQVAESGMLTFTRDLQFLKVAEATEVINLGIFTVASDRCSPAVGGSCPGSLWLSISHHVHEPWCEVHIKLETIFEFQLSCIFPDVMYFWNSVFYIILIHSLLIPWSTTFRSATRESHPRKASRSMRSSDSGRSMLSRDLQLAKAPGRIQWSGFVGKIYLKPWEKNPWNVSDSCNFSL